MRKHIKDKSIINDLNKTIVKYKSYGFKIYLLVKILNISLSKFYAIRKKNIKSDENNIKVKRRVSNPNKINKEEKEKIINYALEHPNYYHREMTYRMIDENVVFVSCSTSYRVLKEAGLIKENQIKRKFTWGHRYSNQASEPDELWQVDITYLMYKNKDVYQLSFIDVYSRFVVLSITLNDMSSNTVSKVFEKYIEINIGNLKRLPTLQTDNGSCFIGNEFKMVLEKYKFNHNRIHTSTPTENIIIERWHRTFKEILYELKEPGNFEELIFLTEKACYYYNYERYHKSLNYVTPYTFYRGNPDKIFSERKIKLELNRQKRISMNKVSGTLSIF